VRGARGEFPEEKVLSFSQPQKGDEIDKNQKTSLLTQRILRKPNCQAEGFWKNNQNLTEEDGSQHEHSPVEVQSLVSTSYQCSHQSPSLAEPHPDGPVSTKNPVTVKTLIPQMPPFFVFFRKHTLEAS